MIVWDENGRHEYPDPPPRKRRAPARAIRFAAIKVGDQLTRRWQTYDQHSVSWYYVVSDLWFDPVAGQDDETAGRMVAIQLIHPRTGEIGPRKEPHTVRGLASQGFQYAGMDYLAHLRALREGIEQGAAVGIGYAHVIRRRPKAPSARF